MPQDTGDSSEINGVIAATDLVAFTAEAVVTRPLVKKAGGAVTAFAFDEGQGLRDHTAPFDALVLALEGQADISIGGTPHRVHGGELLRIPAGQPHAVTALSPFKMLLIVIKDPDK